MPNQEPRPSGSQPAQSSTPQKSSSFPPSHPPFGPTFKLPKVTVFRPFNAWNSPQVDERCFVYCSQTSRDRARGNDPWCRTICFRRVYGHEVHDGSYDASKDINGKLKPKDPLPLPHEGQPSEAISDGEIENTDKTRYWKEGRYIWVSKSRWAAQEKMDTMRVNLPTQTGWMRYKETIERQRYEEEMEQLQRKAKSDNNVPDAEKQKQKDVEGKQIQADSNGIEQSPRSTPKLQYTPKDAIQYSSLFRITPLSSVLQEALHQKLSFVLSPAHNLMAVLNRSFTEGTQTRFFQRAYHQATNGATVTLVRNVWSRHETWLKEIEKEDDNERKKKGGGREVEGGG
ncbi:hypothetical protein K439DRAFT_1661068 [Ramaria rubella]|nr:hypothetical protein K439DRAFT_1661068 [Ramaria rubella]